MAARFEIPEIGGLGYLAKAEPGIPGIGSI
jgi:hypothetical protein